MKIGDVLTNLYRSVRSQILWWGIRYQLLDRLKLVSKRVKALVGDDIPKCSFGIAYGNDLNTYFVTLEDIRDHRDRSLEKVRSALTNLPKGKELGGYILISKKKEAIFILDAIVPAVQNFFTTTVNALQKRQRYTANAYLSSLSLAYVPLMFGQTRLELDKLYSVGAVAPKDYILTDRLVCNSSRLKKSMQDAVALFDTFMHEVTNLA